MKPHNDARPTPAHRLRRCREHHLDQNYFIPQLQRLLRPPPRGDRASYDSLIGQVVDAADPLELFPPSKRRSGVYMIEALYVTCAVQAVGNDTDAAWMLDQLGYARWLAWRRFRDSIRSGAVAHDRNTALYVERSRLDVVDRLRRGWRPIATGADEELLELLRDR